jgi:hypothetical protein
MRHAAYPDEFLEILGDKLRTIVRNDPRAGAGVLLACPLDDRLNFGLDHARANLPVNNETATTIEHAAEVEKPASDVDVRDIHVPVILGRERLLKPLSFE